MFQIGKQISVYPSSSYPCVLKLNMRSATIPSQLDIEIYRLVIFERENMAIDFLKRI